MLALCESGVGKAETVLTEQEHLLLLESRTNTCRRRLLSFADSQP